MMNKKILVRFMSLCALVVALSACHEKKHGEYFPPRADKRVYFIYMAADNSLSPNAVRNLSDIKQSVTRKNAGNGRVIVFYDKPGANTQLLEFKAGTDGNCTETLLKDYGEDLNTGDIATFELALSDMREYAERNGRKVDSYILDMWSHGDAWEVRSRGAESAGIMPLSVAADGYSYLELEEFVEAIEPGLFDAVVFAQCYGASVEMLYLLREKTDLVLGSAPEMYVYGVPYHLVMQSIFAPVFDYAGYIEAYYQYYKDNNASWKSGSMAAFDCTAFTDEFVTVMRDIYASQEYGDKLVELSRQSESSSGNGIDIQTYSNNSTDYYGNIPFKYFDIGDFVNYLYPSDMESGFALRNQFWTCMDRIVLYKRTTGRVFEMPIDPDKFSGMSTYIMLDNRYYTSLNNQYRQTSWYSAVY